MKKIAFFIDSYDPGGAETIVIKLAKGVVLFGYDSEVHHFGNPWLEEKCVEFNLPSIIVPKYKYFKSIFTLPIFAINYAAFLKKKKIDIVHSHLLGAIYSASLSAFLAKIPHIGTIHDIYSFEDNKRYKILLYIALFLRTKLITVSKNMQNYINSFIKIPHVYLKTILNGIDSEELNYNNYDKKIIGLNETDIVLICVGRLVKIKGHDLLIKAFSKLKNDKSIKLLLVGDGPEIDKLKNMVAHTCPSDTVKFLGHRDDVHSLLKISDCFVLSSHSEGLSCSIIEAMFAGLPVVATNVGGNSELVQHGKSGFLVPPNNSEAFALCLEKIIGDIKLRKTFGRVSKKSAYDRFSYKTMINEYIKQYETFFKTF